MKTLQQLEESNASPAEIAEAEAEFERNHAALVDRFGAFCRQHALPTDLDAEELLLQLYGEEDRRQELCDAVQVIINELECLMRFYDRNTQGDGG
jgi:hypothetical protein